MSQPLRILQVVTEMGPAGGGVAVWLLEVLRRIDRDRFRMDFLVHTDKPMAFDDEIRSLGSRIIPCPRPLHFWRYPFAFRRLVRGYGPYDIVHSHVLFGGLVMRLARLNGAPVRIVHVHSDPEGFGVDGDLLRGPIVRYTMRWNRTSATHRLACSRQAGVATFGRAGMEWTVVPCGIDLAPFEARVDRTSVRSELGVPADALVVGHIGRFQEQKNHAFLIEIAADLARRRAETRVLLVGDGPLRSSIEDKVRRYALSEQVRFLGTRGDVPRLLRAVDVFVLPSRYEGLPLAAIEAQAAGVPCLLTDVVTEELDVVPGLVRRLSLAKPPSAWADAILSAAAAPVCRSAMTTVLASPFAIRNAVRELEGVYARSRDV